MKQDFWLTMQSKISSFLKKCTVCQQTDLVAKDLSRQAKSSPLNLYWSLASPWSSTLCCYTYNSKEIEDRSNYVKFLGRKILQNALRSADDMPWGDFISAADDPAVYPSHHDRVLDIFSSLSEIGSWNR